MADTCIAELMSTEAFKMNNKLIRYGQILYFPITVDRIADMSNIATALD